MSSSAQQTLIPLERAGDVVNCLRCGDRCRVAQARDVKARPFQASDRGQCTPCAVVDLLRGDLGHALAAMPEGTDIKDVLRAPHIQRQFETLMRVGKSQMQFDEIDWEAVIAKWDLPLIKRKRER